MKKLFMLMCICTSIGISGCATILGGKVSDCQRTHPAPGKPDRAIRGAALIADIIFFPPGIMVDFVTGAIFKPCEQDKK